MISRKRICSILVVAGIFLFLSAGWGAAQEQFPNRAIQFVIPWAAGGGGTVNAQVLQPHFEKAINGSIQIVNKAGGGEPSAGTTWPIPLRTVTRRGSSTRASS